MTPPTAEEVSVGYDFTGKIALITGATNGMGKEAARVMALRNCKVLLGGRTLEKATVAKNEILAELGQEKAALIEPIEVDLSTLDKIREFASNFSQRTDKRVHLLINNAAAAVPSRRMTGDGFEENFGVNHLAPFLLTLLMLPFLKDTSKQSDAGTIKIINVCSGSHVRLQTVDYDDYNSEAPVSDPILLYAKSKLANLLCSRELHDRLQKTFPNGEIISNAVNPGIALTGLAAKDLGADANKAHFENLVRNNPQLEALTIPQAAANHLFQAGDKEVAKGGGKFYVKRESVTSTPFAEDRALQKKVWQLSERLVGLTYDVAINS